jgi:hypothetical protein
MADDRIDERVEVPASELARWAVVALMILAGVGLFFWEGTRSEPVAAPGAEALR